MSIEAEFYDDNWERKRKWNYYSRDDKRYISWGAGVNSTAIIALYILRKLGSKRPEVVFADTGGEDPEIYEYIKLIKRRLGKENVTVLKPDTHSELYPPWVGKRKLFDALYDDRIMPHFNGRFCTVDWKVRPLAKYAQGRKKLLGICKDELQRMRVDDQIEYPIKDYSRDDCIRLIADAGLPPAQKSRCFFCPFQDKKRWLNLYRTDRQRFGMCCDLEGRTKFNYFSTRPLREQVEKWDEEQRLVDRQLVLPWIT